MDKMYFTLSLFTDLPIFFNENLEFFIFDLFIYTNLGFDFLNKIYKEKGWSSEFESILCDIYRLVDDKNKKLIYNFIENHLRDYNDLMNLNNLKKIIIFHPDLIPNYILRCINEFKEFEIEELIEHCENSEIIKMISKELLRNNCVYLFTLCCPEYEKYFDKDLLKIEKYNLISQRNRK
ncbi:hypothetical protein NBO_2g0006 [Nosema bombycis CQ1]|uniref:Uncharacterized protein n=1 Tax=Nosema bombycis (strain CQ1 / CVCC 102059) TaxID=578461 RepID=R0MC24_NOSB1|nr:hypothetical protein NBO_2g0006 [Nosema bombycis CQ1]|eukprot:EOB15514.1 hypothetical protein NBO_2g0006 [Nosema bombycis CQ1]